MTNNMLSSVARAFALPLAIAGALGMTGCDILDVDNPNNLLEEDVRQISAANAMVNGSLATVSIAISRAWQPVSVASDEMVWIGSRDAWQQLDFGQLSDVSNEFLDENFPFLGRARWMADEAEEIMLEHVANAPPARLAALKTDLARAHLFAGVIYTVLGETQEDFVISDKTEAGPAIGPAQMHTMLDAAIAKLDNAVAVARDVGDNVLETRALAMRARARHSRAIWDKMKPTPSTGSPLVSAAGAVADAQAVLSRVSDDWEYQLTYSPTSIGNNMANWVNSRAENQFDTASVVTVSQAAVKLIEGVRLMDPIDDIPDPVITATLLRFKGGTTLDAAGFDYPSLTLVSARMMRLILAEDALQKNDLPTFRAQINAIRAMDDLTPYVDQIPPLEMLQYARRVNLFLMGLRLNDMYRFGIQDRHWSPTSDALTKPGTLMPITITEIRANPNLSGQG
jgi:starch-binding outer membrane protein, SusD/RagB family